MAAADVKAAVVALTFQEVLLVAEERAAEEATVSRADVHCCDARENLERSELQDLPYDDRD